MESQRLKDTWAKELLGLHLQEIQVAQKALKDAVETANSSLKKSRIARLVAAEVGYPNGSIMVDPAGAILITSKAVKKAPKVEAKVKTPKVIEIKKATTPKATTPKATTPKATTPKATTPKATTPKVKADTGKREWKSDLPTLEVLRAQAETRGVDITHLGRKRKEIHALLQGTETPTEIQLVETKKAPKKATTAPVGQISDTDEVKTKRQTVIRRRKKNVVDLATAAAKTESVDLDQILEG